MPDVRLFRRTGTGSWHPFQGGVDIPASIPPAAIQTNPSGVAGAGFQNAGTIHPTNPNLWLSCGDVAGVHLSDDGGMSWMPNNTALNTSSKLHGIAVRWSEVDPTLAYYFSSSNGGPSSTLNYLFSGRYDATLGVIVRWNIIEQVPGAWAAAGLGAQTGDTLADPTNGHPRESKSRMLALDEANGVAYMASANGLWRVKLDGTGTPVQVWGNGQSLTSVCLNPLNKDQAFVTVDLGTLTGVHRITGVRTTSAATTESYRAAPITYAQSCKVLVKSNIVRVFVASGRGVNAADPTGCIFYWPGTGAFNTGWQDISGNLSADETSSQINRWSGIDVVLLASGSYRILTAQSYDTNGSVGKKVGWTDWDGTGTPTWTKPAPANMDSQYRLGNNNGAPWWFQDQYGGGMMLDKMGFDSVDPNIAPTNPNLWMMPGRSGLWRRDLGSAVDTLWHPAVKGMAVTTSWDVLVSSLNPLKVAFGDVDWTLLRSSDGMVTQPVVSDVPHAGKPTGGDGWMLHESTNGNGKFVIGQGARSSNDGGYLHRSDNPWASPATWVDELYTGTGKPYATSGTAPQVKGVAIGVDGAGTQVILAALRNGGFWRKVGAGTGGTWSQITLPGYPLATPFTTTSNELRWRMAWQPGGGATVWLNDPLSGLWQSRDYGATWTRFYSASWTGRESGDVLGDPTRTGVYYATTEVGKSWKITGGNGATPTKVALNASATKAASVAVHPTTGNIYLAESGIARLWKSTDGGTVWSDITTASWEAMCGTIKALRIGSNGMLYSAMFAGYSMTQVEGP